jgi:hypothetical protein
MNKNIYSGWYNYETWNAALWLDNDSYFAEQAEQCYNEASGDDRVLDATCELEKVIESQFEQEAEENAPKTGWIADAVNAYLGEVNFREIAEHYMADVEKTDKRGKG